MSIHPSLKGASGISKHKNVLTRKERLQRLRASGDWDEKKNVYGMKKVANRKVGKKK
ncbi:MAG: small basic protein [Planctomycetota bacterium]|nr:small basic protein [Planctomycetota bacterium]